MGGEGDHGYLKRELASVDPGRIAHTRAVSRALMASARRAIGQGRTLCDTVHERRRRADFFHHLAKYAETFPRMRRYLPLTGGDGDPLHIEAEERPEALVAYVGGEVDLGNVGRLKGAIQPALDNCRNVILDVSQLRYIDSTGLHAVIDAHQTLQQSSCQLVVVGASPGIAKVMRILHLDRLIPMVSSLDEALALIRTKSSAPATDK